MGILELLGLISTIVGTVQKKKKADAATVYQGEIDSYKKRSKDISEQEQKNAERDARRTALGRAIGSKNVYHRTPSMTRPDEPTAPDTSRMDTIAAVSDLVGKGTQYASGMMGDDAPDLKGVRDKLREGRVERKGFNKALESAGSKLSSMPDPYETTRRSEVGNLVSRHNTRRNESYLSGIREPEVYDRATRAYMNYRG